MSKEQVQVAASAAKANNDNHTVTHVLPVVREAKGVAYVKVCSVEQQSLRCNVPHKHYDVIIRGTCSAAILLTRVPEYMVTNVLPDDWEYIQKRYEKHPSFKNKRIFAEKNEQETIARALDSETQELATMTGSAQITEKDLATSYLKFDDDNGVSDVKVSKRK